MKISIANDHVAVDLKNEIVKFLCEKDIEVIDHGTNNQERVDYPDFASMVCMDLINKQADLGILICGTGVGMSITANKFKSIRCVCCSEPYSAKLSREHNNTNVLAFGSRVIGLETAKMIVENWIESEYEKGRHENRVLKISKIEGEQYE